MGKPNISSEVLTEIREKVTHLATPQDFLIAFQSVKDNGVLNEILSIPQDDLEKQIQKLAYARLVLSDDMYREIGEEWITHPGMTLDKICTIGIGDPEMSGSAAMGLGFGQAKALTGEWLAYEGMTVDKITLLGFGATPQQIHDIGPENIAKMSQSELDSLLTFVK